MEQKMNRKTNHFIEENQTYNKYSRKSRGVAPKHQAKKNHRQLHTRDPGRKCQICGKDPYPNYYYCPKCHGHAVYSADSEEEDDKAF